MDIIEPIQKPTNWGNELVVEKPNKTLGLSQPTTFEQSH